MVAMVAPRANFSRDSASGRSPRFHDSSGPIAITRIIGIISGTITILK